MTVSQIFQLTARLVVLILAAVVLVILLNGDPAPRQAAATSTIAQGDNAQRAGKYTQAMEAYQRVLALQPKDVTILNRLYNSAIAANRPDLASIYVEQLATLGGWSPDLLRRMARLAIARGDTRTAAGYYRASLTGAAQDALALRYLTTYTLDDRDWAAALTYAEKLVALTPNERGALGRLGLLLLPTNPNRGLTLLRQSGTDYQALTQKIEDVYSNFGTESAGSLAFRVGLVLLNANQFAFAENALDFAVGKGVTTPTVLAFLGIAQDQQGRDGWTVISKALEAAPNDPVVNYAAGLHWRLKGDLGRALAALNYAWALQPTNAAIAAEIGLVYRAGRTLPNAAQWLIRALSLAPNDVGFQRLLALFIADESYDLDGQGVPILRTLAGRSPKDADIQASLGWALTSLGQYTDARAALDAAISIDSTNPRTRFYFAVLLEYQGDTDSALDSYLFVYQSDRDRGFRERAARALTRLGYKPAPGLVIQ